MAEQKPLTPAVFHILLSLADGEKHGYAIMQEIADRTGGRMTMGPGTLYGTIKRLLEAGFIEESGERSDEHLDDQRRRYYRLTITGRQKAAKESERLASLVRVARTKSLLKHPQNA